MYQIVNLSSHLSRTCQYTINRSLSRALPRFFLVPPNRKYSQNFFQNKDYCVLSNQPFQYIFEGKSHYASTGNSNDINKKQGLEERLRLWIGREGLGGGQGIAALVGTVVAGIATALGYKAFGYSTEKEKELEEEKKRINQEKEAYQSSLAAAQKLGLIKVTGISERTLKEQAENYDKAKNELYIIGVTGTRIFDGNHHTDNPIPETIRKLLIRGVKVNLMIYDPNTAQMHPNTNCSKSDIAKIGSTISKAQNLEKEFPDHFQLRVLKQIPPFHGDLIDHSEAHIIPIRKNGIHFTQSANIETYIDKGDKMKNIKADFMTVWKEAHRR